MTLAQGRTAAKELKATITLGADPRGEAKAQKQVPTLSTFYENDYLPYVKPRKRSWSKDAGIYENYLREAFGDVRLNEIRRKDVQEFHGSLLQRVSLTSSKTLSPATADHMIKALRQMLNKAVEWDLIPINPIARIKLINADNRRESYLNEEELQRLLGVLQTYENRTVCNVALFLLSTGARLNEALSAKWADVDTRSRVWRISAANSKSKKLRSVPLNDSAVEVLNGMRSDQLASPDSHLFMSAKTGRNLTYVHKVWERIREKAGLPKLRFHDLRHQFASFLVNNGRSLYEVQKILGHSSHSVTERYAHLSSDALMAAANTASIAIRQAGAGTPSQPAA